ncbi:MAG: ribosome maturation factor RimP [Propionibacteriaceae bacterium]|nr:ribosome maturation factor RimP [Propionibacteriaceae bacterium]
MTSLNDCVDRVLVRHGMDLEEIQQSKAGSRRLVRITIDGDGATGTGLTLDEVAEISTQISRALDDENIMGDTPSVLEIGTRGVDRPLQKPAHYRRNVGRLVKITPREGNPFTDRITGAADDDVTLLEAGNLPYSQIVKAVVQVEMNRDEDKE